MEEIVFDKFWFEKHQRKLLWLANSWLGKYVFQFKKMGHYLTNPIVKITPNSVGEFLSIKGDEIEIKEHFFSRNEYARKLYFALLPMWWFMHAWDYFTADHFHLAPKLNFGFSTLTQYPNDVSSPVDGRVGTFWGGGGTWSQLRDDVSTNTSGNIGGGDGAQIWTIQIYTSVGVYWGFNRSIFMFDTSSLTSSATISSAVLSIYGTAKTNNNSRNPDVDIYTSTPNSISGIINTDYAQIGTVSQTGSPITFAAWSTSAYNDFTFNATGIGNVSKTGISKFGVRNSNYDVANSAPGLGVPYGMLEMRGNLADGTTNKPKLVVTYTTALVNINYLGFF